ncbi:hypothetical protein GW17_00048350 [Ensete ventricosum]|nr:hypothetical protein GW17_00048350 [Ensete ventricosum]
MFGLWLLKKTNEVVLEWVKMREITLNYAKLIEVATTTLLVFTTYDSMYSYNNIKDGGGALKKQECWEIPYSPAFIPHSNTLRPCGDQEELAVGSSIKKVFPFPASTVPESSIEFMFQRQVTILAVAGGLVFVLDDGLCVPSEQVFTCGIAPSFLNDDDDDDDEVYLSVTKEWSWLSHCRVYDLVAGAWTMNKELDFGIEALDLVVCEVCAYAIVGHRPSDSGPRAIPSQRPRALRASRLSPAWSSRAPLTARMRTPRPWRPPSDPHLISERQALLVAA